MKTRMALRRDRLVGLVVVAISVLALGCYGPYRVSPDDSVGAGGLKPTQSDRDAGRVGVAPGVDLRGYRMMAVAKFPVVDPSVKDDDGRRLADAMSSFLQSEVVRRLRESALFDRVLDLSETEYRPGDEKALKLDGEITRLDEGDQTLRAIFGVYGGGAARVQAETHIADLRSGQVVIVTADRRQATMGIWGGVSENHIRNALDDIARDLTKFLVRLSKGQAPAP
jgi:Domain of unknown function (DUF4410)